MPPKVQENEGRSRDHETLQTLQAQELYVGFIKQIQKCQEPEGLWKECTVAETTISRKKS